MFLAGLKRKTVADLGLDDIQAEAVLKFLDYIESKRSNSAVTRNCRLAAIRSFVQHLLRQDITRAGQYGRILAIQTKRATQKAVAYLEPEEARAVIAAVDTSSQRGRRDHALLLLLYNTGARISEALAVRSMTFGWTVLGRCGFWVRGGKSGSLSALARDRVGLASYHSRRQRRTFPKPLWHATHQRRRGLTLLQKYVRRCRKEQLGTTASPRALRTCSATVARSPFYKSGRRRDGDSRLPWPRIG